MKSILIVFIIVLFSCKSSVPEKEMHLISDGYIGTVEILFEQPNGKELKYNSDGKRVYEIPYGGLMKTKFSVNNGGFSLGHRKFYYVNNNGEKKKIDWYTQINPLFRNKELPIEYYDSIAVKIVGSGSKGYGFGASKIESVDFLKYRIDSLKNFK